MEDTLNKIRMAREAIWSAEPDEVARLVHIKATGNQAASTVLYATTKLATLITFLNHMRGMAQNGGVDLETMVAVTVPYLEFHAGVFGNFYKLASTAQVVRWASEALPQVQSLEDYAALLEELAIYLNRIDYWIDLHIPWATFGRTFEQALFTEG
jgi:hypothetical protein